MLDLMSMVLNGTSIQDQESEVSKACLTIAQLILFHSKKRRNSSETKTVQHSHERKPLPISIGLNVHTQARSKTLVNALYRLGLSISYNRVEELANGLATAVCDQFEEDGLVCPLNQRFGLFTTGAIDNLDHNPSSTPAGFFSWNFDQPVCLLCSCEKFLPSAVQIYEFHIFIISSSSFPGILRTNLMTSSQFAF